MKKTITIPADLLERVKTIPGASGMTDSQLVSCFLEAGLAAGEKEKATTARSTVSAINRVLERANLRQLSLILGIVQDIVGKEALA